MYKHVYSVITPSRLAPPDPTPRSGQWAGNVKVLVLVNSDSDLHLDAGKCFKLELEWTKKRAVIDRQSSSMRIYVVNN